MERTKQRGEGVAVPPAVRGLARSVTALVTDASRGMARAYDVPRAGVLTFVAQQGVTRPREIAEELDLAPSSVTRHLHALADAGHVDMVADPADRRSALVTATPAGREELELLEGAGAAAFASVVADWADSEVETLTRLLDRLRTDWAAGGSSARAHHTRTADRTPRWRKP